MAGWSRREAAEARRWEGVEARGWRAGRWGSGGTAAEQQDGSSDGGAGEGGGDGDAEGGGGNDGAEGSEFFFPLQNRSTLRP